MRRRTLDVVFSAGGAAVAIALLVLAVVFTRDASFAKNYVADQLGEQGITFTPAEALSEEESQSACLVEYAGQQLTTGKQAECYANDYIGLHLKGMADGKTYAELGEPQRELREQLAAAQASGDPAAAAIEQELGEVTSTRDTLFKGETLRGLLLTTYGFSVFGEKAVQAAIVLYVISGILALLAIAGLVHAYITPRNKRVKFDGILAGNGHTVRAESKASPRAKARTSTGPARRRAAPKAKAAARKRH